VTTPVAGRTTARGLAAEALLRIDDGAFAHILVPELLRKHDLEARDRAFVTDLVYGTVRMRRAIDHLLQRWAKRPLDSLDADVRVALRLGAFQLFTGISPHAAVGETVALVPERARGFANGVLRSLARSGPPWSLPQGDSVNAVGTRTSHPDWIVQSFIDELGRADALATLELDNEPPSVTLRVNPMRTSVADATAELQGLGVDVEPATLVPDALLVRHTGDLGALELVRDGRVTPQDQGSQAVVIALDPQPGDRVLDVAAAPGGKAVASAERMRDDGMVVAVDVHQARVRTIMRAARRCELTSVVPVAADGRRLPLVNGFFDRVLVDAPCTGLGVLRRRADARWRVRTRDVAELAALQRELLASAARAVRPGGRLVYSVCTLTSLETAGVDAFAASELTDFVAVPPPADPWRPRGRGALLVPSAARTDGMFVLVLERSK
jgi:16S rRNA (cytosine967-C5)-methyltransferase